MRKVIKIAVALTCLGNVLTGCASAPTVIQTVTVTKLVHPDIPPALLTCLPSPQIPPMTLQSQVARLLVQEYIAGQDCRLHLAAVKEALGK